MRPTPAGVEVARALIARVKAADSSINRRDELWYASDSDALDRRDWHVRRFAPANSLRMGNGPVTEWVARLEKPEQAYTAAVLRDDALRVVLEWLRSELPWCLTWAPVLGSLHRWQQVWTPNRLRRYEGAAHAERCSRPIVPHGELSTWAFIWLACLWLACLWRLVDGSTHQYWRNAKTWCAPQAYRRIAGHMTRANVDFKPGNPYPDPYPYPCLLYTSPSPRDRTRSRMPSSA